MWRVGGGGLVRSYGGIKGEAKKLGANKSLEHDGAVITTRSKTPAEQDLCKRRQTYGIARNVSRGALMTTNKLEGRQD